MSLGADYPVNMLPYSDKALLTLLSELVTSATIGKKRIYNVGCAFDTEASSFTDEDLNKVGLCYIWMFGIANTVVYGRTMGEFVGLINGLNSFLRRNDSRLIVYVHNLKYDFAFIKKHFRWKDVFIRKMREPLYAIVDRVEFRDSIVLSGGKSLKAIGEKLRRPVRKAVGDLDYSLIRTPETPMTNRELHYCEMDIKVLIEYIREKIEDDGDINKIPYTNTGYVRKYVRNECFKNRGRYMDLIDGLTMTPDCYLQAEKAFGGGAVGPNIKYVGQVIEKSKSFDIKSSYPFVIVTRYFPMGFFEPVSNKAANANLESLVTSMCCLFRLEIFNLVPKTDYCFPISESKCNEVIGARVGSGRVITAAYVSINVTELDYETYKRFYDFDQAEEVRVSYMRIAPRGYLPEPIIKSVLKFFYDKTTLDGVPGKEREYQIAKGMLNSIYGMMVEKVVRVPYYFDDDFKKDDKDYLRQVGKYNDNRNRFLFYPWGVWVTAHARFRLYDAIYNIGDDWRYCDTDCVKYVGDHDDYFNRVNEEAKMDLAKLSERTGIPMSDIVPKAPNGELKYLGVWEREYEAKKFKTIGAKRYLVERMNGKLGLTVAGTNKEKTLEYIVMKSKKNGVTPFDLFDGELTIPPEYAKRIVATFVDSPRYGYVRDYTGELRWYECESGIHMEDAAYSFSETQQMKEAIDWLLHESHYSETLL